MRCLTSAADTFIRTHEACSRIIDKKGLLDNPADRDPEKRSIANALALECKINLAHQFPVKQQTAILATSLDQGQLEKIPVHETVGLYVI
ncbi:MAG: 2-methylcitrate dehydratase PrpD [Candidatus Azotimanducaceae bacterium]